VHDKLQGIQHRPEQGERAGGEEAETEGGVGHPVHHFREHASEVINGRRDVLGRDVNVVSPPIGNELVGLIPTAADPVRVQEPNPEFVSLI